MLPRLGKSGALNGALAQDRLSRITKLSPILIQSQMECTVSHDNLCD